MLIDRLGLGAIALIGIAATASAMASASFASEVWHLYLGLGLVMGFGNASLGGVWSSSLLGRWFPARRLGVAIAVVWSASGVGGTIVLPLAQHLIVTEGWRHAYRVFALIAAAFIPLLLRLPWRRIEGGAPGLSPLHAAPGSGTSVREACAGGRSGRSACPSGSPRSAPSRLPRRRWSISWSTEWTVPMPRVPLPLPVTLKRSPLRSAQQCWRCNLLRDC